ncbi:response regulator (plasmid) [Buttiauxella sp. 3AFRM03]|uniref:helix-turn-helix domain-containing protein n=1 Tax=Buttiauxella sp. 3AFRM03 TaxID=2479367 RepID=UPI000EF78520|nr:helix-turn-helix domain-containing protein [Buttiauxella sp. 3AFRM03]AYN25681.1 response regulator [Buttiauxella sp. 3AFRM03]
MQDSDDSKLVDVLAKVLTMKGVPKLKHNSYISNVLQMTTSAGYKKLTGATKWEVQQLIKVVDSLGMSMSEFFAYFSDESKEIHHAVWSDGRFEHQCEIHLYPERDERKTELSALKIGDKWNVLPSSKLKDEMLYGSRRSIESIIVHPKIININKYRIALLDDDVQITQSLNEIISSSVYHVDTFSETNSLSRQIADNPFDAYVLDWIIGDESCFSLIKQVRESSNKNALIIVLTGKLSGIKDDEISSAIHDYDIVGPFEKPIKSGVIKSNIDKYFAR